jgi:hypothetical protein
LEGSRDIPRLSGSDGESFNTSAVREKSHRNVLSD